MTDEQFEKAINVKDDIEKLKGELRMWEDVITSPEKMIRVAFDNPTISPELFSSFRASVMDGLKLRLIKLDQMFSKI